MQLTFLNASVPLTKRYTKLPDGSIEKSSYPNVWEVTSIAESASNLAEFEDLIKKHAALGNCLLKGVVLKDLVTESRAGSTDRSATTDFLCLDIDGIDQAAGAVTVDSILQAMGLGSVSYIIQWSGSMGISSPALRCHVFMMLTRPVSAPLIKQWLIQMNHEVPVLKNHQALTKTGNALIWGLDITACQSDKLIYIAPPVLKGIGNPLGRTQRISLITKSYDTLDLTTKINSTDTNRALTDTRVLELRDRDGLPKRKLTYKIVGPHEVMVKPGECIATEIKQDRGFVYFNLNGGDSWAYYHPENNPDFIFNFKGEPVYQTKELLPQYWETLKTQAYRTDSKGLTYLAFLDRMTSTYYRGTYDAGEDMLNIYPAKNETMVRQFADANGLRLGANIPEWDMEFNPHDGVRVDFDNHVVNTFERTEYMKVPAKKVAKCPQKIFSVIEHVLAGDQDSIEHYMNWLACIAKFRTRTRTAWVFQGTQGTGKGLLFHKVLAPLFGKTQTVMKRAVELNEKWTDFVQGKFIIFIDEIQSSALHDEAGAISSMKNLITEPEAQIRLMNRNSFLVPNFTNWIYAGNTADTVTIPKNDRRFNVGPYQDKPFPVPTDEWLDELTAELQNFHHFLLSYPADQKMAATPLQNEARSTLIALSETTAESTVGALKDGDIDYFLSQLPTDSAYKTNMMLMVKVEGYRRALCDIMCRANTANGVTNVSRDELLTIFDYTVGGMNPSPTSFTKYLGHRQLEVKPIYINGKTVRGTTTTWRSADKFPELIAQHFNDMTKVKV